MSDGLMFGAYSSATVLRDDLWLSEERVRAIQREA